MTYFNVEGSCRAVSVIKLFVRRVFIMDIYGELIPELTALFSWLPVRFGGSILSSCAHQGSPCHAARPSTCSCVSVEVVLHIQVPMVRLKAPWLHRCIT